MGCALAIVFRVHSLYVPFMGRLPFEEPVSRTPYTVVIRLYSEIDQFHLSSEAQCGTPVYLWVAATLHRENYFRVYV